MAGNVATVTACDGAPVAVTLATGTQGAALDAPVVEFDCVVSGPGAVEEAGTRSPLSANFGEERRGWRWRGEGMVRGHTRPRVGEGGGCTRGAGCAARGGAASSLLPRIRRALALALARRARCERCARSRPVFPHPCSPLLSLLSPDMSTYHELVKKAAGTYRELFVV